MNFMKKITVFAFVILGLLSLANYTYAQTRPTVPPLVPDSVTGCTGYENESRCRPEWADSASKCQVGTLGLGGANTCVTIDESVRRISPYVMVCSSTYQVAGCVPHKVNPYAAGSLAKQAEIMGRSLGYTISCSVETLGMAGYVNPINNLTYGLFTSCTINGRSGFDAYTLVNDPARDTSYTNWDVMATELKSIAAAEACGGNISNVYFNTDGTYRCITPTTPTTPTTPVTPTTPTISTIPSTTINQSYLSYATNLTATLTKIIANLKSQLNSIGGIQTTTSIPASQTTTSYTSSITNALNNMTANLKSQLNSTGTGQNTTSGIVSVQTGATTPSVELTLSNGLKSGTYSVGETVNYQVKMQNVDSVNSFYSAIPKDTCVGGSASGEQKPWIVKTVAPLSNFSDQVEQCQAGSTYIISVVGTNKTSGIINASSASVYIRK
ncbi:MAG: hypothetical protein A2605_03030 [Candidatus Zambryskibacteria bacterium RIFOXYD1_FULL_39_35]|nr:MAG: hypothetical protein A2605_03030 [Candidatus Zambryskibacteria bacterium RIFOXYD1_FULL_39_35]